MSAPAIPPEVRGRLLGLAQHLNETGQEQLSRDVAGLVDDVERLHRALDLIADLGCLISRRAEDAKR